MNAGIALAIFLMTKYLPVDLAGAFSVFLGSVGNAALIWFAAEESAVSGPSSTVNQAKA